MRLFIARLAVIAVITMLQCNTVIGYWPEKQEIHRAANDGDLPTVKTLLTQDPNLVNIQDEWLNVGYTPLHYAAWRTYLSTSNGTPIPDSKGITFGTTELVELLLAYHADVNSKAKNGTTPLHVAAGSGGKQVVELLLANKADVNAQSEYGTPLHRAVLGSRNGSRKDIVTTLLANKAHVDAKDKEGMTPLHLAAHQGEKDLVDVLLANKANVNALTDPLDRITWTSSGSYRTSLGALTPLDLALSSGHKVIADLLRRQGGKESNTSSAKDENAGNKTLLHETSDANRTREPTDTMPVSMSPPTNWPSFSGELTGRLEVRVKNPNEFNVRVGLRSFRNGKDFVVSPNGTETVSVSSGRYDVYFNYSIDPTELYQGDSFTLEDKSVEITITKVVNGNYGIRKVK